MRRGAWSLRRRLVVGMIALTVVVSAVIGTISVLALRGFLLDRIDDQLASAVGRAEAAVEVRGDASGALVGAVGQQAGTFGAVLVDGTVVRAEVSTQQGLIRVLGVDSIEEVVALRPGAEPRTVQLGTLGDYRMVASAGPGGAVLVVGLPLDQVEGTVTQLGWTVFGVSVAGLVAAGALAVLVARLALRPLDRATATASRVSELPLASGEVVLDERVADTDPRTEVGRLGLAINRMLGHVASALSARQASEARVRRFVADASHELRTPLAAIRGYSELTRMRGGDLPQDLRHALGRIESESLRMTSLVEDLLLLARLDEGRELDRAPVDLVPLVRDALSDAAVASSDHEWGLDAPETPVVVLGDAPRLHQVVANLLANARVHTPPGTSVTAGVRVEGEAAVVTVADDGPGVDESVRDTLFERFARADSSRSRNAGSTGLGLSIVAAVVAAHGGSIGVDSRPGSTVFTVRLPLAQGEFQARDGAAAPQRTRR
ncbi:sensor histidine kinase [Herbiconiux sp. SYSU D00978]|uniref:sensor histidine kinase n=1 Tax=Herbiconiux sp. SYSU D00978 TaxID=2812562 RepID=UPI001A959278|nr:HAMP domain-containing sensor histidine kinase [Herbiconiux sp. SYSU D00978]